jgi:hypothetical protein
MKNLLLSAFFVLAVSGTALAQCSPNGNGNAWGNGNGNNGNPPSGGQAGNNGNGNGWGQSGNATQAQAQPVTTIPAWLALRVCQAAQPALYPYTNMTTVQLYNAYRVGMATITYLGDDPADSNRGYYQVSSGGGVVVIGVIESI